MSSNNDRGSSSSNKQFLAVILFLIFISVAIFAASKLNSNPGIASFSPYGGTTSSTSNSNVVGQASSKSNIPKTGKTSNSQVPNSKPVKVVTSNKPSKKPTTASKDKNYVPVSSFITELASNKIYVGSSTTVKVTINPSNATDKGMTFSSSNTKVATVNSKGVVTGMGAGTCTITIKLNGGGMSQVTVQVINPPAPSTSNSNPSPSTNSNTPKPSNSNTPTVVHVSSVKLSQTSLSLSLGGSSTLTATISPSNAANKSVTWLTSNASVATVSNGVVSAKGAGTAIITVRTADGNKEAKCTITVVAKNGWYEEGGKRYYYRDGVKVKDTYVDYVYLDSTGAAKAKVGSFSATLYGAKAWANQQLNVRSSDKQSASKVGTVPEGGKMTILSADNTSTKYIKIKYGSTTGYVYSDYIYINLPDIVPDAIYEITNANSSIFKSADVNIPNVTGKNLYGFKKAYNEKISKTTYYAPLLYPVAKEFQKAYNNAVNKGYNLKVYDSYRPYSVTTMVNSNFKTLYNNNKTVKNKVDYDSNGVKWGTSWFLANGVSNHNRGIALDITITDRNGNELKAQSAMHTLDTRSLRKYNNSVANTLSSIMTSAGFETLNSEWWHFEETNYKSSKYTSFKLS